MPNPKQDLSGRTPDRKAMRPKNMPLEQRQRTNKAGRTPVGGLVRGRAAPPTAEPIASPAQTRRR